jgi:hypothetical protein
VTSSPTRIYVSNVLNGFNEVIDLSWTVPQIPGAIVNFDRTRLNPSQYNSGAIMTVTIPPNTPQNEYDVIVRGSGGSNPTKIIKLNVRLKDPRIIEVRAPSWSMLSNLISNLFSND